MNTCRPALAGRIRQLIRSISGSFTMRLILAFCASLFAAQFAFAADAGCDAQAAEKKLAGAAKNSFVKKCEKDAKAAGAQASCDAQAADKKLAGAAKNS